MRRPPRRASASHAIGQSRQPVAPHGVGWTEQATNNQRTTGARRGAADRPAARVRPTPSANPADLSLSMAWDGRINQRIINGQRALVVGRRPPQAKAKAVGLQRRRPLKRAGVAADRAHDQPHSWGAAVIAPSVHGGADLAERVRPTPSANPADLSRSMAWDVRSKQRTINGERAFVVAADRAHDQPHLWGAAVIAPSVHGGADPAARVRPTPSANPADLSLSMAWDGRINQQTINRERALVVGRGPPQAKAVGLQRRRPLKRAGERGNQISSRDRQ